MKLLEAKTVFFLAVFVSFTNAKATKKLESLKEENPISPPLPPEDNPIPPAESMVNPPPPPPPPVSAMEADSIKDTIPLNPMPKPALPPGKSKAKTYYTAKGNYKLLNIATLY